MQYGVLSFMLSIS